jgi:Fe-S-cluster containining protein
MDHIPFDLIDAQAQATLTRLNPTLAKLDTARRAMAIAHSSDLPKQKLIKLHAITSALSDVVSPECACRTGCNHCCYQGVSVTLEEARRMAKHLNRTYVRQPPMTLESVREDIAVQRAEFSGVPCSLLGEDGRCTVYAVRPLACVVHFNLSETPEACDTITNPGQRVPYLNLPGFLVAQVLAQGPTFADVREWFPKDRIAT